jgi:hypothetical protein
MKPSASRVAARHTRLDTDLKFIILDMRGRNNFPEGPSGLVYQHIDRREVKRPYTGETVKMRGEYLIRADDSGWRIDEVDYPINVAVYGPGHQTHFKTPREAAKALQAYLQDLATRP